MDQRDLRRILPPQLTINHRNFSFTEGSPKVGCGGAVARSFVRYFEIPYRITMYARPTPATAKPTSEPVARES